MTGPATEKALSPNLVRLV